MKAHFLYLRMKSFKYAIQGLRVVIREPNCRIHLFFTGLVILLGWLTELSNIEWALVLICCALVLSAEAFNTSIEHLTDLVSPEINPKAGIVKDVSAAAVLLSSIFAAIIGLIIFLPKLYNILLNNGI